MYENCLSICQSIILFIQQFRMQVFTDLCNIKFAILFHFGFNFYVKAITINGALNTWISTVLLTIRDVRYITVRKVPRLNAKTLNFQRWIK